MVEAKKQAKKEYELLNAQSFEPDVGALGGKRRKLGAKIRLRLDCVILFSLEN